VAEPRDPYRTISASLLDVRARLARAALRVNRDPSAIRLVAVSKTHPIDAIREACLAGQTEFGENRVQEALQKISLSSDTTIKWHLIGHVQSNKARKAAAVFACIHSIDSVDLLRRVDAGALESGHRPEVLVQVDLAGEPTKHGAALEILLPLFEAAAACGAARVKRRARTSRGSERSAMRWDAAGFPHQCSGSSRWE
jgi:pyridoxal phosphate enzyme (YggS family)